MEPIKAKLSYDDEKVNIDITYHRYLITQVLNERGNSLTLNLNTAEGTTKNITYTYTIIDADGNIKGIKVDGIYIIYDVSTLNLFRDEVNGGDDFAGKTVFVTADIDMSNICSAELGTWERIGGNKVIYFAGTFNGNYYTISNLYMNYGNYANLSFFCGTTNTAIIQNVIMKNANVYNSYTAHSWTAALVAVNKGTISNCATIGGTITGYQTTTATSYKATVVGGVVGYNYGVIDGCYNLATVKSTANTSNGNCQARVGGICGINVGIVSNCYNGGEIIGKGYHSYVGGIVGVTYYASGYSIYSKDSIVLQNCYNYGLPSVSSGTKKHVGGIAGANEDSSSITSPATISNCYCVPNIANAYYIYSGSTFVANKTGLLTSADDLFEYASILGSAYKDDESNINNGYPILAWQTE